MGRIPGSFTTFCAAECGTGTSGTSGTCAGGEKGGPNTRCFVRSCGEMFHEFHGDEMCFFVQSFYSTKRIVMAGTWYLI